MASSGQRLINTAPPLPFRAVLLANVPPMRRRVLLATVAPG